MRFILSQEESGFANRNNKAEGIISSLISEIQKNNKENRIDTPFCFLNYLKSDLGYLEEDLSEIRREVKIVFVVGIGGANLAAKAIYSAMFSQDQSSPKVYFFETIETYPDDWFSNLILSLENKKDFVVCINSKSGTTLEVTTNAEQLLSFLEGRFGDISDRIVVVTKKNTPLWKVFSGKAKKLYELPELLSDRYSAFSQTTTVPAYLFGADMNSYMQGGLNMLGRVLNSDLNDNPSFKLSALLYYWNEKNKDIFDLFLFSPRLEDLGKWHRQLFSESVGKEFTLSGGRAKDTFTPTVSVGTTDLHSMLQMNLAQPEKRFTQFVFIDSLNSSDLKDSKTLGELDSKIAGKNPHEIMFSIYKSVLASYSSGKSPYVEVYLETIKEREIAEYFVYSMLSTVFLGEIWNVNVFNQPNVEEYKRKALDLLK